MFKRSVLVFFLNSIHLKYVTKELGACQAAYDTKYQD